MRKGGLGGLICLGKCTEKSYHHAYVDAVKNSFRVAVLNIAEY